MNALYVVMYMIQKKEIHQLIFPQVRHLTNYLMIGFAPSVVQVRKNLNP